MMISFFCIFIMLYFRKDQLLDSTYIASRENGGRVVNELILHRVGEKEVEDTFTCKAMNNNITKPLEIAFKIGINFPPQDVKITELPQKVYAGRTQSIRCIVKGETIYIVASDSF